MLSRQDFCIGTKAIMPKERITVNTIGIIDHIDRRPKARHIPTPLNIIIRQRRIDLIQVIGSRRQHIPHLHLLLLILVYLLEAPIIYPQTLALRVIRIVVVVRWWWEFASGGGLARGDGVTGGGGRRRDVCDRGGFWFGFGLGFGGGAGGLLGWQTEGVGGGGWFLLGRGLRELGWLGRLLFIVKWLCISI